MKRFIALAWWIRTISSPLGTKKERRELFILNLPALAGQETKLLAQVLKSKYQHEIETDTVDTSMLAEQIIALIKRCDNIYFEPLANKTVDGCVPHEDIARLNRLMAELTSRYLLSGF